jgi:hypothetical protein
MCPFLGERGRSFSYISQKPRYRRVCRTLQSKTKNKSHESTPLIEAGVRGREAAVVAREERRHHDDRQQEDTRLEAQTKPSSTSATVSNENECYYGGLIYGVMDITP